MTVTSMSSRRSACLSAARAIWQGDYNAIRHALAANPLVLSLPLADQLLKAIAPLQERYFSFA